MPSLVPLQRSNKNEVDKFVSMFNDPKTTVEGITYLYDYCSNARVVIFHEQSAVFLKIFQNFSQNKEVIEQTLNLIEKILRFDEPISKEAFSNDSFLQIFFSSIESPYSLNSLYYIAKPPKYCIKKSEYCAKSVLDILSEGTLVDSLLSSDSNNLMMNIHFLSVFSHYNSSSFVKFTSKILGIIVDLSQSKVSPSVRLECLSFIEFTLSVKKVSTIYDIFIHKKTYLDSIFKTAPNSRNERMYELRILLILQQKFSNTKQKEKSEEEDENVIFDKNEEDDDDDDFLSLNPASIVLNNDLLSFVSTCLKINMDANPNDEDLVDFDVACYALDIVKEMASVGSEVTSILYQEEIVNIAFDLLSKGDHFYICIRSLLAILEILMHSNVDQKNLIAQNGFFELLSQNFQMIPSSDLVEVMTDLIKILEISASEANAFLLNALFQTKPLVEQFEELCNDPDEIAAPIAIEFMMKAKSLSDGSTENAS